MCIRDRPNTLSSELIVRAGGRNIAYDAATDYPEFSPEAIVSRNPDVIIFPEVHGTCLLYTSRCV